MEGTQKRKVRVGSIEPDPNEVAIVIKYDVETTTFGPDGEAVSVDKKPSHKRLPIKSLNRSSHVPSLAQEIVDNCNLIHRSKLAHVEKILAFLQHRMEKDYDADETRETLMRREEQEKYLEQEYMEQPEGLGDIEQLEIYIEMLYDTMEEKVKGTLMILQLARNPDNLERMIQSETLLGVLSRLLKEDCKKSTDLVINIVYIFFSFSNFSEFHPFLSQYHIGDMTMKVIELEVKRHQLRTQDLQSSQEAGRKGEKSKDDVEAAAKKFKVFCKKQEKLLYVCFHVLLNLAEDVHIEKKMKKRKIVTLLVSMLERKNSELLLLVLTFLKKLSIFKENKDEMAENAIVEALKPYVGVSNEAVLMATLRLLVNLSFDQELRDKMVKNGLIPQLVDLLPRPHFRQVVLKLLYHISMDDRCKSMFTYTDCIPMVMSMILNHPEKQVEKTLVALGINLSANSRNAEMMCENDGLKILVKRLLRTRDALLCKMLRNISQHDGPQKQVLAEFVPDLANLARQCDFPDLLVELLAVLGNINLPHIPFARILIDYDLINFLYKHLAPGFSEDDIVLEIIIFIGTAANDSDCAPILANSRLVSALYELMTDKQEDDEMVLQITYTFYKFIQWPETRQQLLQHSHVVSYLVDLLYDSNAEIRKMADQTLDLIMDTDDEWAKRIRLRKFQMHNAEWLRAIEEEERG
eukprot:CAMPEP_0114554636 /NCGR_PEP_ID=MMETSP0114-20121206/8318_1 /TAXON_ID=31324 /ORGANISM="Goniomonas sp, Strain m" /LENGTH=691 /DNA_ID=CAMNT_0001739701 /DNA_START=77 /DNA_END=2149 /DNA_ORIENTATION=+